MSKHLRKVREEFPGRPGGRPQVDLVKHKPDQPDTEPRE
jgi:hypothetical protein